MSGTYIEVNDEVTVLEVREELVEVFEVADFGTAGDKVPASLGTEEGQILVSLGNGQWMVIDPPAAGGMTLISDLTKPGLYKTGALPTAGQFDALNTDGSTLEVGDPVIWDATYAETDDYLPVKRTSSIGDRRACGTAAEEIVPGGTGKIQYFGPGSCKVKGSGAKGAALRTSNTVGRAEASGGAKQAGFIGFAGEAWDGNSIIKAFIDPDNFRWGAGVTVINSLAILAGNAATANLDLGTGSGRIVLAICGSWYTSGFSLTAPKVAGVAMSSHVGDQTGWAHGTYGTTHADLFKTVNPPEGTQTLTGYGNPTVGGVTLFVVLGNVHPTTPLGTGVASIVTSSGPSVACVDAQVGGLVIGGVLKCDASASVDEITAHGAGQTNLQKGTNTVTTPNTGYGALDRKDASASNESLGWTISVNEKLLMFAVPVNPA